MLRALFLVALAASASAQTYSGRLAPGDAQLDSGEYMDEYTVSVRAGQTVRAVVTSQAFDTYVIVKSGSGEQAEDDDCTPGETTRSCAELVADRDGRVRVLVTSYAVGETGAYDVQIDVGSADRGDGADRGDEGLAPAGVRGGVRTETGRLAPGDETLRSGEFLDAYTVTGTGGPLVVDLTSSDFDPYLIVEGPGDVQFDNDDHEGALDRSLLVVDTRDGETYRVLVTSYAAGETGAYRLDLRDDDASSANGVRTETGRLEPGDATLREGEFVDTYTVAALPGQRFRADLTSDAFDTFLVVETPTGETLQDDDGGGRLGHSVLDVDLTEPGTYRIHVTSYAAAETGPYELRIDLTERFGQPATADRGATASGAPARSERRPAAWSVPQTSRAGLDLDRTLRGELDGGDQRLRSGEFMEVHTFDGEAGEPVRVEMTSDAFDTYLIVAGPSGDQLDNDDFEGDLSRSVVEFTMPESGRYRVTATSYRPGETGAYEIRISQADALAPEPLAYDRIVGLFVGISDYDRMSDLRWTAQDAGIARDALVAAGMDPGDGILLTDREATAENVRAALRRLAARSDDQTLVVLFFSGHGGQYDRADAQRADPDGLDESLELFDAPILDDELDQLLAGVPAARQLVVLDACFSGGFSKDVISRPGRMGLFSSEEDVLSFVADKFEAGGYLSRFFADAVAERQADADGNGAVTAQELSLYLDARFLADVGDEAGSTSMVGARDTRPDHQKLVVDRGSIGLYESLFLLRP